MLGVPVSSAANPQKHFTARAAKRKKTGFSD
jgi:hypothetical protein